MLSQANIKRIIDRALAYSTADQTEVYLDVQDSALTRFANSYIHQNVSETTVALHIRAVMGKSIGIASTNYLTPLAIREVVDQAKALAQFIPPNPDFISLPHPLPIATARAYIPATARFGPHKRAQAAGVICRKAKDKGLSASGAISITASKMTVANSLGVWAEHRETLAEFSTVIMSDTGSGHAQSLGMDAPQLDPEALADEAIDKAIRSQNPIPLEPGEYEIILEEYAVSDLLDLMAYLGFSALAVQEERSFMKLGEKVVGDNITIWDDGLSPSTISMPIDFEGVPRQPVDLIVDGVARAVCYDSLTAGKEGKTSTGHALPPGITFGPVPLNMFLKAGDATKEQMVAGIQRGIWVSRFWYTRPVHPLTVTVTGMTRDGTFLIENGEISHPVKSFRFTQSYLEALKAVGAIARDTRLMHTEFAYNRVPALKIRRWNFTGVSEL